MQSVAVIGEGGEILRRTDVDDDGCTLPPGMSDHACLVGAFRLLEEIARKDDNAHYRGAARKQADALKQMIKRMAKDRGVTLTDREIFGNPLAIGGPHALPPTNDLLTIDMK